MFVWLISIVMICTSTHVSHWSYNAFFDVCRDDCVAPDVFVYVEHYQDLVGSALYVRIRPSVGVNNVTSLGKSLNFI